jgi:WD40 repeat protein
VILHTLSGHQHSLSEVAFAPDGEVLATASYDKTVKVWNVADGTLRGTLGPFVPVRSVAFSPDGQTLVTGSEDAKARLWQVSDGAILRTFSGHTGKINSVAYSPDGQILATGADSHSQNDYAARWWRVSDGTVLGSVINSRVSVESVAFSPDGQTLAVGEGEPVDARSASRSTVSLWRISDGVLLRTFSGPDLYGVYSMAFSPDGQTLATATRNNQVLLWATR